MDSQALASSPRSSIASLVVPCAWLTLALLAVAPLFAWFGYSKAEWTGVLASAIAAGLCWAAGILALITAYVANRTGNSVQGVFAGMLFRVGIPLFGGLMLERQSAALAGAGIFPLVLGFYLFVLVIETLLSLRFVGGDGQRQASAS